MRPDNYEITYIMHNLQPWRSDKPCTYNPISRIDEGKIVKKWWFQHIVHDTWPFSSICFALFRAGGERGTVAPTL